MGGYPPYTLEDMHQLAQHHGGQCLSTQYVDKRTKLRWQCQHGHIWESAPSNIVPGHWCRICARNNPYTLDEMHQLARDRGGQCLSTQYINTRTKLRWQCAQGHQWAAGPGFIVQGGWCPTCDTPPKETLAHMQKLARRRKGKCLSPTYINITTKLCWECEEGHQWETTPKLVKQGRWCPACALAQLKGAAQPRYTITDMQHWAAARGGVCLSEFYRDKNTKLRWQCARGHVWETTPHVIRRGCWCPACARLKQIKKFWLAPVPPAG